MPGPRWWPFQPIFARSTSSKNWSRKSRSSWDPSIFSLPMVGDQGSNQLPSWTRRTGRMPSPWRSSLYLVCAILSCRGCGGGVGAGSSPSIRSQRDSPFPDSPSPTPSDRLFWAISRPWHRKLRPMASPSTQCFPAIPAPSGRSSWRLGWPNRPARARLTFWLRRAATFPSAGWRNPKRLAR